MPVSIMLLTILFNSINAILIAYHFVFNAADFDLGWLYSTYFISGIAMFALGFAITKRSDAILRSLLGRGEDGYKIPHGFLYIYQLPQLFRRNNSMGWLGSVNDVTGGLCIFYLDDCQSGP